MGRFKNPNDPENIVIREKIKEWLYEYCNIAPLTVTSIEEIPCWEPHCPDVFTKILIQKSARIEEIIIRKPLVFIRKVDILAISKSQNL